MTITIITYLIILYLILNLFFKVDYSKTYCGIFAFSGKKNISVEKLKLAYYKFIILGLYNESRGEKGSGIYVNETIIKDADRNKKFRDFIANNNEIITKDSSRIMIGHCRNPSVGTISLENTHPFLIKDKNDNYKDLVGVMNGTVKNIEELAKKYNIGFYTGKNDSKTLFEIIQENEDLKVLEEYKGGAALIWTDSNDEKMYVFHGKSKDYSTSKVAEERPLYFLETENGVFFSSIFESLSAICEKDEFPEELDHNKVFEVIDGKIEFYTDVNRENVINNSITIGATSSFCGSSLIYPTEKELKKHLLETMPKGSDKKNKVFYCSSRYWVNNGLCNGEYFLDRKGFISTNQSVGSKYYFYRGIMIKSYKLYKELMDELEKGTKKYQLNDIYVIEELSKFSTYPISHIHNEINETTYAGLYSKYWFMDGKKVVNTAFSPKFSYRAYKIINGALDSISTSVEKTNLFHSTLEEALFLKEVFSNPLLPIKIENSNSDSILDQCVSQPDAILACLSKEEADALFSYYKDDLQASSPLDPDEDEIHTHILDLFTKCCREKTSFYNYISGVAATSIRKLVDMFKEGIIVEVIDVTQEQEEDGDSDEESGSITTPKSFIWSESDEEEISNAFTDSIDILGDLRSRADDLQAIDSKKAQGLANIIYKHTDNCVKELEISCIVDGDIKSADKLKDLVGKI